MIDLVNDISFSFVIIGYSSAWVKSFLMICFIIICFCSMLFCLDFLADTLYFDVIEVSSSYLRSSLAFCSITSIYGLLTMITCIVYGAQLHRCFVILGLYLIKIS